MRAGVAVAPARLAHEAPMLVVLGCCTLNRERAEAMITYHGRCSSVELPPIDRMRDGVFPATPEWRASLGIGADVIAVPPGDGAVARVELRPHFGSVRNPHVGGKNGVQCSAESHRVPLLRNAHSNRLASRMHARVSATGAERSDGLAAKPRERILQHPLYGSL